MVLVTRKHLAEAAANHKEAAEELTTWQTIAEASRWRNLIDLKATFPDADYVDGYVVFNIRHNRYRLITVVHFAKGTTAKQARGHIYLRSLLTHKEYDNKAKWDPYKS